MNNKLPLITKKSSALFLAIVLVTGTITAISPLFITGVNAQGDPYYGMDSYDDRKPYGMDDSYGASDYGMDKDRKSYDNSYKSQYQSYKPDYKPVKDDKRDKSKDSKVDINKIKCINTNLNINGNNTGNVSIGNKGQGYLAYSSAGGGYSDEGYGKQGKGFDCTINNNNNNTNVGAGNGNVTEPLTCEECFETFLTDAEIEQFGTSVVQICLALMSEEISEEQFISDLVAEVGVPLERANNLVECLIEAGIEFTTGVPG